MLLIPVADTSVSMAADYTNREKRGKTMKDFCTQRKSHEVKMELILHPS